LSKLCSKNDISASVSRAAVIVLQDIIIVRVVESSSEMHMQPASVQL